MDEVQTKTDAAEILRDRGIEDVAIEKPIGRVERYEEDGEECTKGGVEPVELNVETVV